MKETLRYTLEVDVEIDGVRPSDEILHEKFIEAMNEGFPSVAFDDDDLDCAVFVDSWCYEPDNAERGAGGQKGDKGDK